MTLGLVRLLQHFLCRGVMRNRSLCATSLILGFFGTARIGSGGASAPGARPGRPGLRDRAIRAPVELAAGSRPTRLRSRGPPTRRARGDRCRFGDHLGDEPPHWPAGRWPRREAPPAHGFGGHDDSLLYLVCTDWRVTPKASPICCHDQPFSRADATWFASTLSARRCSANEARNPMAGSSDERFKLSSSMSMRVSMD